MSQENVEIVRRAIDAWNRHSNSSVLGPEFPDALEVAGLSE